MTRGRDSGASTTRRLIAAALAVALVAACGGGGLHGHAAGVGAGRTLATLPDGRRLNFHCTGRGAPLVLLESGYGRGLDAWTEVQPEIARFTRVCAYDRAGYGASDPGPLPRDGAEIARDLDQGLDAAELYGPYVVVGHSAGALYARLFAARRPGEVKGLVLVDATVEAIASSPEADGLQHIRQGVRRCLALAESASPPGDPQWKGCVLAPAMRGDPPGSLMVEAWRNRLSELDSIFSRTSAQAYRVRSVFGGVPAYVLTASETAASSPTLGYGQTQSVWELQHMRLALDFGPGYQRTILSSHRVPADRPEVIADAVKAMVLAARANVAPPPLEPSETEAPPGDAAFGANPR